MGYYNSVMLHKVKLFSTDGVFQVEMNNAVGDERLVDANDAGRFNRDRGETWELRMADNCAIQSTTVVVSRRRRKPSP